MRGRLKIRFFFLAGHRSITSDCRIRKQIRNQRLKINEAYMITEMLKNCIIKNLIKKVFETNTHTHSKNTHWESFSSRDFVAQLIDVCRKGMTTTVFLPGSPFSMQFCVAGL